MGFGDSDYDEINIDQSYMAADKPSRAKLTGGTIADFFLPRYMSKNDITWLPSSKSNSAKEGEDDEPLACETFNVLHISNSKIFKSEV